MRILQTMKATARAPDQTVSITCTNIGKEQKRYSFLHYESLIIIAVANWYQQVFLPIKYVTRSLQCSAVSASSASISGFLYLSDAPNTLSRGAETYWHLALMAQTPAAMQFTRQSVHDCQKPRELPRSLTDDACAFTGAHGCVADIIFNILRGAADGYGIAIIHVRCHMTGQSCAAQMGLMIKA